MHRYLLVGILSFVVSSFSYAAESSMSLAEFKQLAITSDNKDNGKHSGPWDHFSDFQILIETFTQAELNDYSRLQQAHLEEPTSAQINARLEQFDIMAFKRAYPHLAPAFQDKIIQTQFKERYQMKYSFGWKRWFAWSSLRLSHKMASEQKIILKPLMIDLTYHFIGEKNNKAQGISWLGLKALVKLAVCNNYKPAIVDVVRWSRVKGQLLLSAPLSYLLMLRLKQNKMRVIFKDQWLSEIDKDLSELDKKKYQTYISKRGRLYHELSVCTIED